MACSNAVGKYFYPTEPFLFLYLNKCFTSYPMDYPWEIVVWLQS